MQADEILDALEEYLRQDVGGTREFAWQAPYKGDLFT
jgi:phage-related protein